ncbi:hypothetical protein [Amycolatopsis sp. NPDC059021]|uniref:hypothetical protein n=1 Tax=Amycolatopsis sp. NPDC059021 TaxID=3346704 RepID=UPI00366F7F8D
MDAENGPAPPHPSAEPLRRAVAAAMDAADSHHDIGRRLEKLEQDGFDLTELREQTRRAEQFLRQVAAVSAAQALEFDGYMAAGGPANPQAHAEYLAATQRATALLPQDDLTWTPPPLPDLHPEDD